MCPSLKVKFRVQSNDWENYRPKDTCGDPRGERNCALHPRSKVADYGRNRSQSSLYQAEVIAVVSEGDPMTLPRVRATESSLVLQTERQEAQKGVC